jgi:hypothetical protein
MKKLVFYKTPTETLYKCTSLSELKDYKLWSFNRPIDNERVTEIASHVEDIYFHIGIIYAAKFGDEYVVYDGMHRLEALRSNKKEKIRVLVNIVECNNDKDIYTRFKLLNLSVPVSSLYTEQVESKYKTAIEHVVRSLVSMYPSHFSPSRNPRSPNKNRDLLTDELFQFYQTSQSKETGTELLERIHKINIKYMLKNTFKNDIHNIDQKCARTGCYLFLKGNDFIHLLK